MWLLRFLLYLIILSFISYHVFRITFRIGEKIMMICGMHGQNWKLNISLKNRLTRMLNRWLGTSSRLPWQRLLNGCFYLKTPTIYITFKTLILYLMINGLRFRILCTIPSKYCFKIAPNNPVEWLIYVFLSSVSKRFHELLCNFRFVFYYFSFQ